MDQIYSCERLVDPPTYQEFFHSFLIPNRPVILGPRLVESWEARGKWISRNCDPAADGNVDFKIDWEYLSQAYGHHEVIVADCATREFSDQKRQHMLFREVAKLWDCGRGSSLYVKDWHLARAASQEAGNRRRFYTTPDIFRDDWMNAYYSACTDDDFRFVYVGAEGTFTPLHRDVYTSYSWSTNVCGRKRWWLFPPDQTRFLLRKGGEEHLETAYDVRNVDCVAFPGFAQARAIVIDQEEGETIFVPSGWYHQVENLTACISINHNWCNSSNLPSLYASMRAKVAEVEHALEDVKELLSQNRDGDWEREWAAIVQDVVEKDAGWNWLTFWRMILHALRVATADAPSSADPLWQPAPAQLMPPLAFVKGRVRECYDDFVHRTPPESTSVVPDMHGVLREVGELLG
ncbi:Clavaminate synthase-like protein [Amylocystis lapponica]|nr:Clavaminate synthase-like protein [Amylocystis lapponica]